MEAVHGAESYKFDPAFPAIAPSRNVMLVFTRNAIGPMDYTPVTLSDVDNPHLTTNAHELGLAVAFESGIQHFADRVEAYRGLPAEAKELLKAVPAAWDETRLLDGDPSSYAVVARRKGSDWWIGAISGEEAPRQVDLDLSFLPAGRYELTLAADGSGPRELRTEQRRVGRGEHLRVQLLPRGGFLARIRLGRAASR
jgi:hypothetical protein